MKWCDLYIGSLLLFKQVKIADTFFSRLKGLMGVTCFGSMDGLLLYPCNQIHTYFMKLTIDALFLDKELRILSIQPALSPGKLFSTVKGACYVLELPEGTASKYGLRKGDVLLQVPCHEAAESSF